MVTSRSRNEHISHLKTLFDRLETNGLVIKPEKCVFGVAEIDFLGHRVTKEGITPLPSKIETIQTYPEPPSAKEPTKALERFLGMFNYYHKFVPNAAELLHPLYQALQASPPANKKLPKVGTAQENSNLDTQRNLSFQSGQRSTRELHDATSPGSWCPTSPDK